VGLLGLPDGLVSARVSSRWMVVVQDHEVTLRIFIIVDIDVRCVYESF
jgi:hypothetical protein